MTTTIGFGYRARSGKDTAVAEIIKQRSKVYDIRKYSFADALRQEVVQAMFSAGGWPQLFGTWAFVQANGNFVELPEWVRQGYEEYPEVNGQYPFGKQRAMLQWWGTEYRRSIDTDYWVKQLAKQIEKEKPQYALITDMRFPNEMEYVRSSHGVTIKVDRPGLPPATHASETALEDVLDWDYILYNGSTLEEFQDSAVFLFDAITDEPTGYGFGV